MAQLIILLLKIYYVKRIFVCVRWLQGKEHKDSTKILRTEGQDDGTRPVYRTASEGNLRPLSVVTRHTSSNIDNSNYYGRDLKNTVKCVTGEKIGKFYFFFY